MVNVHVSLSHSLSLVHDRPTESQHPDIHHYKHHYDLCIQYTVISICLTQQPEQVEKRCCGPEHQDEHHDLEGFEHSIDRKEFCFIQLQAYLCKANPSAHISGLFKIQLMTYRD